MSGRIWVRASGIAWRHPDLIDLLMLRVSSERPGGCIGGVFGMVVIVATIFPGGEGSGRGIYGTRGH